MKLDFSKPNPKTVSWIDSYFQNNPKLERIAERIADRNYNRNYDGWDEQPVSSYEPAFDEFISEMSRHGITEDDINHQ